MNKYVVSTKPDGTRKLFRLLVTARNMKSAKRQVMMAEHCPERAIASVKKVK